MVQRGEAGKRKNVPLLPYRIPPQLKQRRVGVDGSSSRRALSPAAMFVRFQEPAGFHFERGVAVGLFQSPGAFHIARGPDSDVLADGSDVTRFRELAALKPSQKSGAVNADHARDRESRVSSAVALPSHIG